MSTDQELSDTFQIVIGVLVCIAVLYYFGMKVARNDFVEDCMTEHTEQECIEMWRGYE